MTQWNQAPVSTAEPESDIPMSVYGFATEENGYLYWVLTPSGSADAAGLARDEGRAEARDREARRVYNRFDGRSRAGLVRQERVAQEAAGAGYFDLAPNRAEALYERHGGAAHSQLLNLQQCAQESRAAAGPQYFDVGAPEAPNRAEQLYRRHGGAAHTQLVQRQQRVQESRAAASPNYFDVSNAAPPPQPDRAEQLYRQHGGAAHARLLSVQNRRVETRAVRDRDFYNLAPPAEDPGRAERLYQAHAGAAHGSLLAVQNMCVEQQAVSDSSFYDLQAMASSAPRPRAVAPPPPPPMPSGGDAQEWMRAKYGRVRTMIERALQRCKFDFVVEEVVMVWNAERFRVFNEHDSATLRLLFHGTNGTNYAKIFQQGFQRKAERDAGNYGAGYYFTTFPEYALVYKNDAEDAHEDKELGLAHVKELPCDQKTTLIASHVILGRQFRVTDWSLEGKGQKEGYDTHFAKVLPPYFSPIGYDSPDAYDEVVVFDHTRVLPRYLVSLRRRAVAFVTVGVPDPAQLKESLGAGIGKEVNVYSAPDTATLLDIFRTKSRTEMFALLDAGAVREEDALDLLQELRHFPAPAYPYALAVLVAGGADAPAWTRRKGVCVLRGGDDVARWGSLCALQRPVDAVPTLPDALRRTLAGALGGADVVWDTAGAPAAPLVLRQPHSVVLTRLPPHMLAATVRAVYPAAVAAAVAVDATLGYGTGLAVVAFESAAALEDAIVQPATWRLHCVPDTDRRL